MGNLNKVMLIGRCGTEPEVKNFDGGGVMTKVRLATSEVYRDKQTQERKEKTSWHQIVFFGRLAEVAAQLLTKGKEIYVEGKLQTREYEKNGEKRYITEVVAGEMQLLGKRETSAGGDTARPAAAQPAARGAWPASTGGGGGDVPGGGGPGQGDEGDDDIPFVDKYHTF